MSKRTAIMHKLADADPDNKMARRDLFVSCIKLGDVSEALGNSDRASTVTCNP